MADTYDLELEVSASFDDNVGVTKLLGSLDVELLRGVEESGDILLDWVRYAIPKDRGMQGGTASHADLRLERTYDGFKSTVFFNTEESDLIASVLHGGSGIWGPNHAPYPITPKNGQALAFEIDGRRIYRKRVMHPGIRPTHFMDTAGALAEPRIRERLDQVLPRAFRSIPEIGGDFGA